MNELRLPSHISDRVSAWVAETPKDGGHVDNEAARYGGVSLMGTIGAVWLLRPDATFWEVDDDSGRPLQPLPVQFHTIAIVAGAQRHVWLRELLPIRPPNAVDCPTCQGQGLIADAAYCSACSALGWLPA
jgi:hypothetical protein